MSRSRIVPLAVGAAAATGLGMVPLHRLPHTVRTGYVMLPAALVAGVVLVSPQLRAFRNNGDREATPAPGPRIPAISESVLSLALGGLVAGAGAASIRLDRGVEGLLRRCGVPVPRVWMGLASGALTLAMAVFDDGAPESTEVELLEERVLELLTEVDPMAFTPGELGRTPTDEYQSEAETIAAILLTDDGINAAQLDEVWDHWFDEPLTPLLGEERIAELAAALNALTSPPSAR